MHCLKQSICVWGQLTLPSHTGTLSGCPYSKAALDSKPCWLYIDWLLLHSTHMPSIFSGIDILRNLVPLTHQAAYIIPWPIWVVFEGQTCCRYCCVISENAPIAEGNTALLSQGQLTGHHHLLKLSLAHLWSLHNLDFYSTWSCCVGLLTWAYAEI